MAHGVQGWDWLRFAFYDTALFGGFRVHLWDISASHGDWKMALMLISSFAVKFSTHLQLFACALLLPQVRTGAGETTVMSQCGYRLPGSALVISLEDRHVSSHCIIHNQPIGDWSWRIALWCTIHFCSRGREPTTFIGIYIAKGESAPRRAVQILDQHVTVVGLDCFARHTIH